MPMHVEEYPVNRVLGSGMGFQGQVVGVSRPDRPEHVWAICNAYPVKNGKDEIGQVVVTFTDITVRKRAEAALRESDDRFHALADNIAAVFWITSPDFKVIRYVSPAYERIWGRSVVDLYADPEQWEEAILPEDRDRVAGESAGIFADKPAVSVEYRIVRPDGTICWIHDRAFQIRDKAGKLLCLTGIASDITERKMAEAEREKLEIQNRRLQKSESLGRMAGAIAHHFNNRLQAVMLNLELAASNLPEEASPVESLTEAMQSARKAAEVSTLMLTYLGQARVKNAPLNLTEFCRQSLVLLRSAVPRSIVLETDLP
ncbi:MAG: PAS domain-containing protein, partial [Verrucomicrobiales bacterium]